MKTLCGKTTSAFVDEAILHREFSTSILYIPRRHGHINSISQPASKDVTYLLSIASVIFPFLPAQDP